jgi:glycoprotein 3-alpha-L-fucosyltransferase
MKNNRDNDGVSMKMPPRLSARRLCLLLFFFGGVTVLVTLHQRLTWPSTKPRISQPDDPEEIFIPSTSAALLETDVHVTEQPSRSLEKLWFFQGGTLFPTASKGLPRLFPDQVDGDRVIDQLMYVPEDYQGFDTQEKLVLAYNGLGTWGQKSGPGSFHGCPVSRCSLTDDRSRAADADAILYKDHFIPPSVPRPAKQVWIMYFLECPYHTQSIKLPDVINWTATYRRDSDLVAPYERWTYFDPQVRDIFIFLNYF